MSRSSFSTQPAPTGQTQRPNSKRSWVTLSRAGTGSFRMTPLTEIPMSRSEPRQGETTSGSTGSSLSAMCESPRVSSNPTSSRVSQGEARRLCRDWPCSRPSWGITGQRTSTAPTPPGGLPTATPCGKRSTKQRR